MLSMGPGMVTESFVPLGGVLKSAVVTLEF